MSETMREALENAIEEQESESEEVGGSEESTKESVGAAETEEATSDVETASVDEQVADEAQTTEEQVNGENASTSEQEAQTQESATTLQAPASWKAGVREKWSGLPPEVQEEVLRREKNINEVLQHTAEQRKFAEEFNKTVHPFEPLIASQNSTPLESMHRLMTTAAGLTLGTPQQKAQIVSQIIGHYGVDIAVLDGVLSGQQVDPSTPETAFARMLDERLAPVNQFMNTIQQQRHDFQQTQQEEIGQTLEQFSASHEFFEDVRLDMADLMELAANRGQTLELEDAYNKAIAMNPEVSQVMQGRRQQENAATQNARVQQKREAASSVPSQGDGGSAAPPTSLRGALEEAFDNA